MAILSAALSGRIGGDAYSEGMTGRTITYTPNDAPEVEVLVDGTWHFGALRQWQQVGERWQGTVSYNTGHGMNWIKQFDQDLIRPYEYPATDSGSL